MRAGIADYFRLKKVNDQLARENATLRQELKKNSYRRLGNGDLVRINDTLYRQQFYYTPARVINSSVAHKKNFLTIDRGWRDGVESEMGVIGQNGMVGIVSDVSEHYATVMPVLNLNFYASVRIRRTDYFGLLHWKGADPNEAFMKDVPKYADVQPGDSVVTRGASGIFPRGVMVGRVKTVEERPESNYLRIRVELATDFHNTYRVYIVKNVLREEQKKLERSRKEDHVE